MKYHVYFALITLTFSASSFAETETVEVNVTKEKPHEECFFIGENTKIEYKYKSNNPLAFNLHFHDDKGMNYLIELPNSTQSTRVVENLTPKQVYCLMWELEKGNASQLSYSFELGN